MPPFKEAEFDIMYGQGISREGIIVDLGTELEVIDKSGAWYSYGKERLGQGRANVKKTMQENPQLADEIENKIRELVMVGKASVPSKPDDVEGILLYSSNCKKHGRYDVICFH